jgi:hypothetical protein
MADFNDSWRRMLAQQTLTTGGQGITPQQAAALQYGDIMGNYDKAAGLEKLGLQQKQIENQKAYQEGSLALGGKNVELGGQELAARNKQFYDQLGLQQAALAEREREFGGTMGLNTQIFNTQKSQADQRYNMLQDQIASQNQANIVKGAISAPIGAAMLYGLGKGTGANDFLGGVAKDFGVGKS